MSVLLSMMRVNIAEAKARLSELIDAVLQGRRRHRAPQPGSQATAFSNRPSKPTFGMFEGRIEIADDFAGPLHSFSKYMPPVRRRQRKR
jgi:hypothetical protein